MSLPANSQGLRTAVLVVCAMVPAACASDGDAGDPSPGSAPVVQLGAPGETSRVLSPEQAAALDVPEHTEADVDFVSMMIAHHEQALVMTALVDDRAELAGLPVLAERMEVSQRDEIGQLEAWLTARAAASADGHEHADETGSMPGMASEEELVALAEASGAAFDRLFLELMIRHHEGAIVMVEELLTGGSGGQEPAVFQLAQHIGSDQQVEIARMKELLAGLDE